MSPEVLLEAEFDGVIFEWRGPAPFYFIALPDDVAADIAALAPQVTYGWGVIPVSARIGTTTWTTSLFPKDGGYLLPVKAAVRTSEDLQLDDATHVHLSLA